MSGTGKCRDIFLMGEVVVGFVDIGSIVDYHCLKKFKKIQ